MNVTIPPPTNVSPIAGYNHVGLDGDDAITQPIKIRVIPKSIDCHNELIKSPPIHVANTAHVRQYRHDHLA